MDLGILGKKAAVAAASTGLGFGCAKALLEDGAEVAICSRSEERIMEAAADLGAGAVPIVADMSTEDGARSFVEQAIEKLVRWTSWSRTPAVRRPARPRQRRSTATARRST